MMMMCDVMRWMSTSSSSRLEGDGASVFVESLSRARGASFVEARRRRRRAGEASGRERLEMRCPSTT